jgi:hypothetical protein
VTRKSKTIESGPQPAETPTETDVSHLGVLVGDARTNRIIALATSAVFENKSLTRTFWGIAGTAIDSGFQGHLYTRPKDTLVVRVPDNAPAVPQMVLTALDINCEIWESLTGIRLSSGADRIVLASDRPRPPALAKNIAWYEGGLLEAAAARFRQTEEAFLAFVLNNQVAELLLPGLSGQSGDRLKNIARTTSRLMDKNDAMRILHANHVACPETFPVDEAADPERLLNNLPGAGRYVFKPSGGAAGIGVFSDHGRGAAPELIGEHLKTLRRERKLPLRYQVQEFVEGVPYGLAASFGGAGAFEIFEIHQQIIDEKNRFVGAKWTPELQAAQMNFAEKICRQIAAIEQPAFSNLICLDIIAGKVIEVNPRLTASAPIAHILRRRRDIARRRGSDFKIARIELNTNLNVPFEKIENGTLRRLIENIWKDYGALVLPQGLNPFGSSRFVFVNDDREGTAQQAFIRQIV